MLSKANEKLLFAALISLGIAQIGWACKDSSLRKVDGRLKDRVRSLEIKPNIDELRKYMGEDVNLLGPQTDETKQHVGNLIKADEIRESPQCDAVEFELLDRLYHLLHGKAPRTTKIDCVDRIKAVFDEILVAYVKKCRPKYEQELSKAAVEIPRHARQWINRLLSEYQHTVIKGVHYSIRLPEAIKILHEDTLLGKKGLEAVAETLMEVSGAASVLSIVKTDEQTLGSRTKKLGQRLMGDLLNACEQYTSPTNKAAQLASLDVALQFPGFDDVHGEYLRLLSGRHLCKIVEAQSDKLIEANMNLMKRH